MANYPTSLDTLTNPTSTDTLASPAHSTQHINANDIVEALEAKVGIGSSTPTSGTVLAGTGTGSSAWQAAVMPDSVLSASMVAIDYVTGRYYEGQHITGTTASSSVLSANTLYGLIFPVSLTTTFDRIGINVLGAGAGGTAARLGIYASNANREPATLLLDAGTVAVDSTGVKEITISQSLTGGSVYWLAIITDGAPTISGLSQDRSRSLLGSGTLGAAPSNLLVDNATSYGALPTPFPTTFQYAAAIVPAVMLRAT